MSELAKRVLSALVLAPLALFAAWTGGLVAALLVALLSVLVAIEWMRMTGCTKTPLLAAGAALVFAYVILIALVLDGAQSVLIGAGIAALAVLLAVIAAPGRWWVAGIFYAGALGGALVLILGKAAPGFEAIVLIFLIVWMTDIAAYFGGRAMGGP
ncbi:MAG: phosphatidate cytidylyltransferase, partial [Hyphomicrobiaceae bacterium]|nr:phosphatidate cytidylyltransferase [Hyphomicrobiaceae bacterium]